MPLDYSKAGDFDLSKFTGTIPDISGAVTLLPNNRVANQFLTTLDAKGTPTGWKKVGGAATDGYHAYLFKTDGSVRRGGKQTFTPDGSEQDAHLFNKPMVSGGLAPTRDTPGVVVPVGTLEAPTVSKVASGVSGFPQGEYLAAISYVSAGGKHTLTTNPVQLTVNTDGKLIEFKLLLDADKATVKGQGLWLSAPVALGGTPDPSTLRLQDVAPNTGRTYTLKGPYNYGGRLAPTVNETAIGTPPALVPKVDFHADSTLTKWLAPGKYVFYIVQATALGSSLASPPSTPRTVKDWKQGGWVFHPTLDPDAVGYYIYWQDFYESSSPPFYQLVRTTTADRSRYFSPTETPTFFANVDSGEITNRDPGPHWGTARNFSASSITDLLTVTSGKFPNGQEVRVSGSNLPGGLKKDRSYWVRDASGSSFKLAASKNGRAINLTTNGSGQIATYEYVKPPPTFQTISIQADPPTEDTSGIPDPTGDIDVPTAVGLGIPEAGTYLVGYTRVLSGRETPISDMVSVTLSSGEVSAGTVIKMQYPPRTNKIPNALYSQLNQKNLPLSWTIKNSSDAAVTIADTNHNFEKAGVFYVQTSGSLANTGRYPNAQTASGDEIAVDSGRIETVAGWLEVANRTTGTGYIELVQLDSAKAEIASRLTLATLSSNGAIYFQKTIALTGLGADLTLDPSCQYIKIQWGAQDNPRQLRVKAHTLIWAPQRGIPRRYQPKASVSDFDVATTDPAAQFPNTHMLAIGQPPPTAASLVAQATSYEQYQADLIESTTFEDQAIPAGWTVHRSPADANTEVAVTTSGAIEGAYGLRIRDSYTTVEPDVFIDKEFPVATHGPNLSVRFLLRLTTLPTQANTYWQICGITSNDVSQADPIGLVFYRSSTSLKLMAYRWHMGAWYESTLITSPTAGTVLDVELKVKGLGTSSGSVECWIGQGGAARTLRFSKTAISFTNSIFTSAWPWLGSQNGMGYPSATATVDFDSVYITKSTYTGPQTVVNQAPALTPLVQPDWPWLDGTILNGPNSSPVDYTHTTSPRSNLSVAATFNRTGALAAERTLMQIRNSAGTEVVGLYMKTDHTVELRKGATPYQASAAVPTGTNYRFGLIVENAGSNDGVAFLYRTIGTGSRELIVMITAQDFSATQAQRATVANNTELTETNIVVTDRGEYVYDNVGPSGEQINQGYVSILPADVTSDSTNIGFEVEEFFVKEAEERTFAVFMRPEDLPDDAAPFTIVAYDATGASVELGSAYADGTAVANASPGWAEYWLAYTPPEGYTRIRIEHRNMTSGRYVFMKALDAPGNLSTTSARAALRDDRYALTGTYTTILNARIPSQSGTMMDGAYKETRMSLEADSETLEGLDTEREYTFTANASTDVLTLTGADTTPHRWQTGSTVRLETTNTLPAPLALDTTYYVRDASTTTLKLSTTSGGTAINITDTGTGTHTIYGVTGVSVRWRSSGLVDALSTQTFQSDPANVIDQEWVEAEMTLSGDGVLTPTVPVGSPQVFYAAFMPMLLMDDRTPLPGGVYIGGGGYENNLLPPFWRSMYDTTTIGDKAAPRSITDVVGRLHSFTLNVFDPRALSYIYSDEFLDRDHVIEAPYLDLLLRVRFYDEPGEPQPMVEYDGFDENRPFAISTMMPMVVPIERAEVRESAALSGEAPGTSD